MIMTEEEMDEQLEQYELFYNNYSSEENISDEMTTIEAIKGLQNLFNEYELDLPYTDSLKILHMAVAAMKKQDKKKIVVLEDGIRGKCPVCGKILHTGFMDSNFCHWCGQELCEF